MQEVNMLETIFKENSCLVDQAIVLQADLIDDLELFGTTTNISHVSSAGTRFDSQWKLKFEQLPPLTTSLKPSTDETPNLELKPLPSDLKYAYLEPNNTFPVVVSSQLTPNQEGKLLEVLRKHKGAIGWTLADIKGISPLICTHKIYLEENAKTSREMQRRLNPTLKEVVKKEVLKLLEVGIIYPISDNKWVSSVQVVPKKSGLAIVKNEQNELIPTRIASGWCMCIDYRKLNAATRKDHFPLPFLDQVLDKSFRSCLLLFLRWFFRVLSNRNSTRRPGKDHFYLPFRYFYI